jgi:hypothetical protein
MAKQEAAMGTTRQGGATRWVIYVRRSYKEATAADISDEQQLSSAKALLPTGATVTVITDSGGHQSGRSEDRDGYQELVARVKAGQVDGIAVYDLSRLARNAHLMLNLREELEKRQVALAVATLPSGGQRAGRDWRAANGAGRVARGASGGAGCDSRSSRDHVVGTSASLLRGALVQVPPRGFEPLISTLKGWRPGPLDDGGRSAPECTS